MPRYWFSAREVSLVVCMGRLQLRNGHGAISGVVPQVCAIGVATLHTNGARCETHQVATSASLTMKPLTYAVGNKCRSATAP